jgi:hypothetical protein
MARTPKPANPSVDDLAKTDLDLIDSVITALQPLVDQGIPRAAEVYLAALDRRAGALKLNGNSGKVRSAVDSTIQALRESERLTPIDSARITALEVLADAVDADPSNASLWREYRTAEAALREVNDDGDDEFADLLNRLRPSVGDPKDTRP